MKKWTYKEVKEYIESFRYKLLSEEYISPEKKLLVQCDKGHIYETSFYNFKGSKNKKGRRCRICASKLRGESRKLSYEHVKAYIESFGYKLLSTEYKNNREKLLLMCDKGHIYEISFDTFRSGRRCCECYGNKKLTYKYVKEYIKSFNYELLSEKYVNSKTKLRIKCDNGHIYEARFNNFKEGNRCPFCTVSKGEDKIIEILKEIGCVFISQYKFNDCRGKERPLPFDFYLPDYNCCIEYDGTPHYIYGKFNTNLLDLMNRKYTDNIKTQYCKDNNIKLIRIPYWKFDDIKDILEEVVK